MEEELLQKELECEAELAKLKRERETIIKLAEYYVEDFKSLLKMRKKNP